jgi:hypothetical protein
MDEHALRKMSTEILTDIKEWRRAHPRATYVQIEDEVHTRMMQLEAQIIEGAVQESPSREWGRGSGHEAAPCPTCAVPLQARGTLKRTRPRKWRTKCHSEQDLRDMPQVWGRSFSPSMRS